ncbi:2'-5' RNA ligase family protein [uncultured Maricaulis sp.]|uniref:2'-5' RNA ligase family protein n=1 Tax=uncultured Maricaulis sp. TaxID=174710 RepID=UPI0030D6F0E2|tara:strand:+ start:11514 stop:12056 length:543 start_codon:yes stop_codon:yes gene_type:complete
MPATTFLALVCPEFALADYEQIQLWRREHDAALADQVLPHFTLVFPVDGWKPGDLIRETQTRLEGQKPFEIVLDRAVSHSNADSEDVMEWLVPTIGREALSALQDRLYAGALAPERRAGPAAMPHITIGRGSDGAASQVRVRDINEAGLSMRCRASAVQIVRQKGERVKLLERIELGRER